MSRARTDRPSATREIHHPDGRVELADTRRIDASPLYNPDLAPVPGPPPQLDHLQLRGALDQHGALHPDLHARVGADGRGHELEAGALHDPARQHDRARFPILLNSHPGTKYGIPFPVFARAAYGTIGSNLPALMRALVACGWFGIQAWIGGEALHTFFRSIIPGLERRCSAPGFGGHTTTAWLSFLLFWGINIFIIYRGMDLLRNVENWAAPFVLVMTAVLLVWAVREANGLGPLLAQPGKFDTLGEFLPVFVPSLTAMIGYWATLSLNMPDFTRFGRSQREQIVGQVVALPDDDVGVRGDGRPDHERHRDHLRRARSGIRSSSSASSARRSSSRSRCSPRSSRRSPSTSRPTWCRRPTTSRTRSRSSIRFKTGGLITGIIGILMQPWKLLADPSGYIFTLAARLLRRSRLDRRRPDRRLLAGAPRHELKLEDLYLPDGSYRYSSGWNWNAVIATTGVAARWPGAGWSFPR